ncbi:DUF3772 domain-containing protein [Jannaschia sp. CCS1]|uniref:DUF3772 domain-containing protein n=1 Tax=Jannaschia sp. (strain CCS1) TaxID=290400 RepID=UPI00140F73E4|nr:DUF3772 domain-containing protein [Jannaschia sp. CCS1]
MAAMPGAVVAQTTAPDAEIDYEAWEREAAATEAVIEGARASTSLLETRRLELVRWRAQFLASDASNEERIATIQSQIDALGPGPADGDVEPDAIADRRTALGEAMTAAQAPGLQAREAFNRANGLIAEIDTILLERQTQLLLERDPTPLNPANWAIAINALVEFVRDQQRQKGGLPQDPDSLLSAAETLPLLIFAVVVGLALIVYGRPFVARLGARFLDTDRRRGRTALGFAVSLGQLLLPLVGFLVIILALDLSGLLTEDLDALAVAVGALILSVYIALWIAGRLFPDHEERAAAFDIQMPARSQARRTILFIGVFAGLAAFAEAVAAFDVIPPAARGVFILPAYAGLAWMFIRFGRLMRAARAEVEDGDSSNFGQRVVGLLTRALTVIAVVGPVLVVFGYINAAEAIMLPTVTTLLILGILLVLQSVIRDLYAVLFRSTVEAAADALLPVIVNFSLFVLATPLLALVWGVRPERLQEIYARVLEGFTLGDTRITPGIVLAVLLVFAAGVLLTRILQGALKSTVLPRTKLDVGARNAVSAGVGYVGIALACVIAVTSAGIDLTALGFVVGALSVGIGFGLQNVVSNFVSGIILLIERPISEGDWIEVAGNMGIVKDISVRSTTIETFDKTDVIVPNADFISGTVTNWTRGNTVGRVVLTVGVAYGNDTRRVADLLMEIANGHDDVVSFPAPGVDFLGFGADSLDFRVRVILRDINLFVTVQTELYHRINETFVREGIEIPFAQRDVWLRNPETLQPLQSKPEPQPQAGPSTPPQEA